MQKIFCIILAVMMIVLAGCGSASQTAQTPAPTSAPEQAASEAAAAPSEPAEEAAETETAPAAEPADAVPAGAEVPAEEPVGSTGGSNVLVMYFSRTGEQYDVGVIEKGNTAIVAEMIAEATGADTFEVLPADDHYPMTYKELTDVGLQEQRDHARPAFAGELPDFDRYDTIFIGSPVWWGDWPMIMYTVFESTELSGKTLIPFSTHAGSGLSGFDRSLASAFPGCTVGTGLAVEGTDAQNRQDSVRENVNRWLEGLGF